MAKPDLGVKRVCGDCGARFYDLRKPEIICPKCGTPYEDKMAKTRRTPANEDQESQEVSDLKAKKSARALGQDDDNLLDDGAEDIVSLDDLDDDLGDDDDSLLLDDDSEMDDLDGLNDINDLDDIDDIDDDDMDDDDSDEDDD